MMSGIAGVIRTFMAMGSSTTGMARTLMTRFVMMCVMAGVTRTFMAMDSGPAGVARTLMTRFVMKRVMAGVTRTFLAMSSGTAGVARTVMTRFVMMRVMAGVTRSFMTVGSFPCTTAGVTRIMEMSGKAQHRQAHSYQQHLLKNWTYSSVQAQMLPYATNFLALCIFSEFFSR
jgi:hypothetical protein